MLLGKQTPIWGGVFTRFEDIDRNTFALVSFDEMTQAVEAQRRTAAEKLEAERRSAHELEIAKQVQIPLKIAAKVDRVDKDYFKLVVEPLVNLNLYVILQLMNCVNFYFK